METREEQIKKEIIDYSYFYSIKTDEYFKVFGSKNFDFSSYERYMKPYIEKLDELDREYRFIKTPELKEYEKESDDDIMSIEDFIESVNQCYFNDYDGYGKYMRDNLISDIIVYPSDIIHDKIRKDFNKIIWYNK